MTSLPPSPMFDAADDTRQHLSELSVDKMCPLLGAVAFPCAAYDSVGGLLYSNDAFQREFVSIIGGENVSIFVDQFEWFQGEGKLGAKDVLASLFSTIPASTIPILTDPIDDQGKESPLDQYPLLTEGYCRKTGNTYILHWALVNDRGTVAILLSVQNITARQEAIHQQRVLQEELFNTSRTMSVGEMATTLAHELNQPLGAIVNYLNAAEKMCHSLMDAEPRLSKAIALANKQASQAAAVVARIREFVQTRQPKFIHCNMDVLIGEVVELLQLDAQQQHVKMVLQVQPDLPSVLVDKVMIQQVITNLIRNGIDSMGKTNPLERKLLIEVISDVDYRIQVKVIDQGCGISQEHEHQLFTPFFTTKREGMGAGLSICRSFIEFHRGSLYFERNPIKGLTFVFTLPQQGGSISQ